MNRTGPEDLVFFLIAQKRFAFPSVVVHEVLPMVEPTSVPGWPEYALGLIDVRGVLIPLLDVSPMLGQPERPLSAEQYVLLLEAFQRPFGIVVDAVEGVRSSILPHGEGIPSAEFLGTPLVCRGVVMEPDGPVMLLDPDGLVQAGGIPTVPGGLRPEAGGLR
ncbi:MAG: chemotaxis protein CheW [Myxococcaceae bacterium]